MTNRVKTAAVLLPIGVVLAIAPVMLPDTARFLAIDFFIMALFAASYNLVFGVSGMLSFCHGTFYGAGAYAVALAVMAAGIPLFAGLLCAGLLAGLLAAAIGWIAGRTKGIQFAMLTLALGQLVYTIVVRNHGLTGGDDGLPITLPDWARLSLPLYYLSLGVLAAGLGVLWTISKSPFGRALSAIRQNSQRAQFIGLNIKAYQLAAFTIAGTLAGVAGGLRGITQQAAYPTLLAWTQSAEPLLMTLAGGVSSFFGPIVGAALFVVLNFFVTRGFDYPLFIFGVVILVVVLFLPSGLTSLFSRLFPKPASSRGSEDVAR